VSTCIYLPPHLSSTRSICLLCAFKLYFFFTPLGPSVTLSLHLPYSPTEPLCLHIRIWTLENWVTPQTQILRRVTACVSDTEQTARGEPLLATRTLFNLSLQKGPKAPCLSLCPQGILCSFPLGLASFLFFLSFVLSSALSVFTYLFLLPDFYRSRYSDWLRAGRPWVVVRVPGGARFPPLHVVQTGCGALPASYPVGTGNSFPGRKAVVA
jgi:hypothetical protein